MNRTLLALALALFLVGCGAPGPADELGSTLRLLTTPGQPSVPATKALYEKLDGASRAAVDARAALLSAELGRPIKPFEAIQFRGFAPNAKLAEVEARDVTETTGTLHLTFASAGGASADPVPPPLDLKIVREEGQWRISLPELAASISQATPKAVTP